MNYASRTLECLLFYNELFELLLNLVLVVKPFVSVLFVRTSFSCYISTAARGKIRHK